MLHKTPTTERKLTEVSRKKVSLRDYSGAHEGRNWLNLVLTTSLIFTLHNEQIGRDSYRKLCVEKRNKAFL